MIDCLFISCQMPSFVFPPQCLPAVCLVTVVTFLLCATFSRPPPTHHHGDDTSRHQRPDIQISIHPPDDPDGGIVVVAADDADVVGRSSVPKRKSGDDYRRRLLDYSGDSRSSIGTAADLRAPVVVVVGVRDRSESQTDRLNTDESGLLRVLRRGRRWNGVRSARRRGELVL